MIGFTVSQKSFCMQTKPIDFLHYISSIQRFVSTMNGNVSLHKYDIFADSMQKLPKPLPHIYLPKPVWYYIA